MTPYELATALHRELSPMVPKLSAALNRALVDIGEGSGLVLPEAPIEVSFQEKETVSAEDGADVLSKIFSALPLLERNSRWRVAVDRQRVSEPGRLELVYTLYRVQSC
jgi:hypothetical protein